MKSAWLSLISLSEEISHLIFNLSRDYKLTPNSIYPSQNQLHFHDR